MSEPLTVGKLIEQLMQYDMNLPVTFNFDDHNICPLKTVELVPWDNGSAVYFN